MSSNLTCLKVFIASPGGLAEERKAFRDVINEYNETDALPRGVLFMAVGWEDTLSSIGRPQTIINEDVRCSDFFVLLLWNRWGSPPDTNTSRFTSGTEEEYHLALECCQSEKYPMRQLVMMFKSVDAQQLSDPGTQLQKVLEFRRQIENKKVQLFTVFDTTESFQKVIRKHLAAWLRGWENDDLSQTPTSSIVAPGFTGDSVVIPQILIEPFDSSITAKAWALADEGRLIEAEVEFAKLIVGRQRPQPLIEYGRFLLRVGRFDQAKVLIEGAISVAKDQGDQQAMAIALGNIGIMLQIRGDLDGAEQMHRKSLEINERLGRLKGTASQYTNLGILLKKRGDLDGAEQMHRKSLEINERLGRLEGTAGAYGNLGNVLYAQGDLDGAEQMFYKCLDIEKQLGNLEGMANAYMNIGNVFQDRGDLNDAEQMLRKSLEISERLGYLVGMANAYGSLGIVLQNRGELDDAEQMHRKSLEINERLGCLVGMADAYGNLGIVLQSRGELDDAEQMHRKSLEINERLGRLEFMANQYKSLGNVFQARGDLDGAEQMYEKSLAVEKQMSLPQ